MDIEKQFEQLYQQKPTHRAFCPYRVCPLGAHVDHQHGLVTGFALDRGVEMLYVPTEDGTVTVRSMNYPGGVQFRVGDEVLERQYVWSDFAKGAAYPLRREFPLQRGFIGLVQGTLPVGGLSSSAAVILTYLQALCKVNDLHLTQHELIGQAMWEEKHYIGVNVGKLDQSCEVYCKKDHLLFLDTQDDGSMDNEHRLGAVRDMALAVKALGSPKDTLVIAGDNVLDFSFRELLRFEKEKGTSCVMCHEEKDLKKQQKTAIITVNEEQLITSYEEKPREPKGNLAVPPFYVYRKEDVQRIEEALQDGCGADAPGSFAAWLSRKVPVHAWKMEGKRYDIGDRESYERVREKFGTKGE